MSLWGKWRGKALGSGTKQRLPPPKMPEPGPLLLGVVVSACVRCDDEILKAQLDPRSKALAVHALCADLVLRARRGGPNSRWAKRQVVTLMRFAHPKTRHFRLVSSRGRWSGPPI